MPANPSICDHFELHNLHAKRGKQCGATRSQNRGTRGTVMSYQNRGMRGTGMSSKRGAGPMIRAEHPLSPCVRQYNKNRAARLGGGRAIKRPQACCKTVARKISRPGSNGIVVPLGTVVHTEEVSGRSLTKGPSPKLAHRIAMSGKRELVGSSTGQRLRPQGAGCGAASTAGPDIRGPHGSLGLPGRAAATSPAPRSEARGG